MTEFGMNILNNVDPTYPLTGFVAKSPELILEDLIQYCQTEFEGNIDLTPTSPLFILLQSLAHQYAEMWETLEGLYYSRGLESAQGTELDNIGISVALPRYRATKARGKFEFTRLRDPITGVFYRLDPDTGTLLPIPPYTYLNIPTPEDLDCTDWTPEYLKRLSEAKKYRDYFKKPLPQIIIPEDLEITLVGDNTISYTVEQCGIIDGSADGPNNYTLPLTVSCNLWGDIGNMNQYYKRSAYFPGAISKIVSNSQNHHINMILSVTQEEGLYTVDVSNTTLKLHLKRRDPISTEVIICNCWHYYNSTQPKPNGNFEYHQIPLNIATPQQILNLISATQSAPHASPDEGGELEMGSPAWAIRSILRNYLSSHDEYYIKHPEQLNNVEIIWLRPDNFTLYNMDFRNIAIDDDTTWFIPDPSVETDKLYTYFRPVYDQTGTKVENSLDYLIFRPLLNYSLPINCREKDILVLYAGFGNPPDTFFHPESSKTVQGYIGPNHISVVTGQFLLPPRGDNEGVYLHCRPRTSVRSGYNLNIGYALQIEDITGGREYESDVSYKHRIKTTKYEVTSTGSAIEKAVSNVDGVISALVYDTHIDPDDPLSIGFKVKVRTEDNVPIQLNDSLNTTTGKIVHDIVKYVKPAGVQYAFDMGFGYGIAITLIVVGINYPEEVIITSIKTVVKAYIRSLDPCKPLDYSRLIDIILKCSDGVYSIKSLVVKTCVSTSDPNSAPPAPNIEGDTKKYISSPYTLENFGDLYYVPPKSYAYFDEERSSILVITEKVIHYGGCGRSNDCNK